MSLFAVAALLRLVPYGVILYIAIHRQYPWLIAVALTLIAVAAIRVIYPLTTEQQLAIASLVAFLLMMHALRLPRHETTNAQRR